MNPLRSLNFAARQQWVLSRIADFPWHACGTDSGADWQWGVPPAWLAGFCRDWAENHDWDDLLDRLDIFNHTAERQTGLHALHLPASSDAPVIVLLHGWPSTCLEFAKLAHSLHACGLDVLVPSLPGYPLAGLCRAPIGPADAAAAILQLIERTGYRTFVVHGGDWGAEIAVWMGLLAPDRCRGVHLAMRGLAGNEARSELRTDDERRWKDRAEACYRERGAYMELQTREPLTLGYTLIDSPVAMAAWICDKFLRWTDGRGRGPAGAEAIIGRHFLLDTVTLYAVTDRAASALWMYPGYTAAQQIMPRRLDVPTAIFALPNDPVFPWPPRSLLERHYHIVQWTDPPHGAHFAALEMPILLEQDLLSFIAHRA